MNALAAQPPDEVWREMRLHMEWSERLSLVFLFAPDAAALTSLRQWADDAWQWRTAPMKVLAPTQADGAVAEVMAGLQAHYDALPTVRAPVWVELLAEASDAQAWDQSRAATLARLNEAREWLTGTFKRPLVLCLPPAWLRDVGHVAPDLWHVRSFVASVSPAQPVRLAGAPQAQRPADIHDAMAQALDPLRLAVVRADEAHATKAGNDTLRALWDAKDDLCAALLDAGRAEEARTLALQALAHTRQLRQALGDGPQVLRDLSVSLNNVGDAESQAGRGEAALAAYRESLELSRQLRQALGDGPQVLDDLAVSLERIAASAVARREDRRKAADEAVRLRQQLVAALPESDFHRGRLAVASRLAERVADVPGKPVSDNPP